jgi:hypothetical protein
MSHIGSSEPLAAHSLRTLKVFNKSDITLVIVTLILHLLLLLLQLFHAMAGRPDLCFWNLLL